MSSLAPKTLAKLMATASQMGPAVRLMEAIASDPAFDAEPITSTANTTSPSSSTATRVVTRFRVSYLPGVDSGCGRWLSIHVRRLRGDVVDALGPGHADKVEWRAADGDVVSWSSTGLAKRKELARVWLEHVRMYAAGSGVRLDMCPRCRHMNMVCCTCPVPHSAASV